MPKRAMLVLIGVLLAVPIVLPLLVNTYAHEDPTLWGFPFYFWWQFLLVIVAVAFTTAAYRVLLRLEKDRKSSSHGHSHGGSHRGGGDAA
ncbi:MAG: DUF3311 domain-containing protein [Nocardioidaceae bacterium]